MKPLLPGGSSLFSLLVVLARLHRACVRHSSGHTELRQHHLHHYHPYDHDTNRCEESPHISLNPSSRPCRPLTAALHRGVGQPRPADTSQAAPEAVDLPMAHADRTPPVLYLPHSGHSGVSGFLERDGASSSNCAPQSQHLYSKIGISITYFSRTLARPTRLRVPHPRSRPGRRVATGRLSRRTISPASISPPPSFYRETDHGQVSCR